MSELDLLCQAIQTQETVESNGVKFVYMDENTIYRFQNNKMKAISKSLLNKARKAIEQQTSNNNSSINININNKKKRKQSTKTKSSKTRQREIIDESTDEEDINEFNNEEEEEEYEEPVKPIKQVIKPNKQANKQASKQSANKKLKQQTSFNESTNNNISLDEYYNNKNRMEYMNREMERLTNKITKLKQYKAIVNKITGGGEIDELPTTSSTNQNQYYQQKQINDSLFL